LIIDQYQKNIFSDIYFTRAIYFVTKFDTIYRLVDRKQFYFPIQNFTRKILILSNILLDLLTKYDL